MSISGVAISTRWAGALPLDANLVQHDVDVSWWVTEDAYQRGYYTKLYLALVQWIADAFPFKNPFFSNREIPIA
jgi:hypothetical protein